MKLGRHFQDNKQMLQRQADLFYLSCNALLKVMLHLPPKHDNIKVFTALKRG